MKVPLIGGAYQSRSIMASAQRCVNLYSEKNPEDSPYPETLYTTPGIKKLATASANGWRGLYTTTTGALYGVAADRVYFIDAAFAFTELGVISTVTGAVSMVDNGIDLVLVDGSDSGFRIDLQTNVMTPITNSAFYGSSRVDLVDGYLILNRPRTNQWYISQFLNVDFDALDFAAKTGFSDKVVAVAAAKRQVFVFGDQTTEVWYNTGDADFTFGRMPGAFIQYGCVSAASIAQTDGSLYWLSKSKEGECLVLRTEGYDRARISTFAIEKAFQSYAVIEDASAYIYQEEGHTFYVLNFPSADKTWAFDVSTGEWAERMWLDDDGFEHRQRQFCYAFYNGQAIVGDWQNGNLYRMGSDLFTDDGEEIRRIRSFPHMVDNGNRVRYDSAIADIETGNGIPASLERPELRLRWSDTRGRSWGTSISNNLGSSGEFLHSCAFKRLGMARDRVFELSWAANCKTALNGMFVDLQPAGS